MFNCSLVFAYILYKFHQYLITQIFTPPDRNARYRLHSSKKRNKISNINGNSMHLDSNVRECKFHLNKFVGPPVRAINEFHAKCKTKNYTCVLQYKKKKNAEDEKKTHK